MAHWRCIAGCGACCNLNPSDRPDLDQYLTPAELDHYLSLMGEDGWCIHYDADHRRCRIYEHRPDFCRVQADTFGRMFGIEPEELDEFAIACCQEQIEGVYGTDSDEWQQFTTAVELPETSS